MNIKHKFTFIDSSFNTFLLKIFLTKVQYVFVKNKTLFLRPISLFLSIFLFSTAASTNTYSNEQLCEEVLNPGLYKDYNTELFPFPLALAFTNKSHRISFIPKSDNEVHIYPLKSVNDEIQNKSEQTNEQNSHTVTEKELLALKQFLSSQEFLKDWSKPFKKLFVHFKINGHSLKRILSAVESHQLDLNNINYRELIKNSIAHTKALNLEQQPQLKRQIYLSFESEFGTLTTQENHPVNVFKIETDNQILKSLKQNNPEYADKHPEKISLVIDEDHSFYQISLHTGFESSISFETLELINFISTVIIPILIEEEQRERSFQPKN